MIDGAGSHGNNTPINENTNAPTPKEEEKTPPLKPPKKRVRFSESEMKGRQEIDNYAKSLHETKIKGLLKAGFKPSPSTEKIINELANSRHPLTSNMEESQISDILEQAGPRSYLISPSKDIPNTINVNYNYNNTIITKKLKINPDNGVITTDSSNSDKYNNIPIIPQELKAKKNFQKKINLP